MPQFTLICTDDDQTVTTKEFEATILDDVVGKTEDFLKINEADVITAPSGIELIKSKEIKDLLVSSLAFNGSTLLQVVNLLLDPLFLFLAFVCIQES